MLLIDIPLFFAATARWQLHMVCQRELYPRLDRAAAILPLLMSIGVGLAVNNTKAMLEALFHKPSQFARTPKYRIERKSDEWNWKKVSPGKSGVQPLDRGRVRIDFAGTLFYALPNGIDGTVPFLMLFQIGFLCTRLAFSVGAVW